MAHVGLEDSGTGSIHTGARGLAHVPEAITNCGEWLGDILAGLAC